jgi:phosphoribosyl 1,2-cyclic phosphodiesterase
MTAMRSSAPAGFTLRFWGVRGSYPTPGPLMARYGGNTTCVEVRVAGQVLVLDAGTGIIALGQALLADGLPESLWVLFSHLHQDHIIGLPFFAPLYQPRVTCHFFGPILPQGPFSDLIRQMIAPPYFPLGLDDLPSTPCFHPLDREGMIWWQPGLKDPVLATHQQAAPPEGAPRIGYWHSRAHPRDGALVYRIEWQGRSLVFATDIEGGADDEMLARFAYKADILIHDAQYSEVDYLGAAPKRGYGHSTPQMAARLAASARVGQLLIFHHDPTYDDAQVAAREQEACRLFPHTRAAFEGLTIHLL